MYWRHRQGFSVLNTTIAIAVGSMLLFMSLKYIKTVINESHLSAAVHQINTIYQATENYYRSNPDFNTYQGLLLGFSGTGNTCGVDNTRCALTSEGYLSSRYTKNPWGNENFACVGAAKRPCSTNPATRFFATGATNPRSIVTIVLKGVQQKTCEQLNNKLRTAFPWTLLEYTPTEAGSNSSLPFGSSSADIGLWGCASHVNYYAIAFRLY